MVQAATTDTTEYTIFGLVIARLSCPPQREGGVPACEFGCPTFGEVPKVEEVDEGRWKRGRSSRSRAVNHLL